MLQFCNYPKLRIRLVKPRFRVHLLMNSMNVRLFSPFELKEQCYRLRITNLNNYRHSLIISSPNFKRTAMFSVYCLVKTTMMKSSNRAIVMLEINSKT